MIAIISDEDDDSAHKLESCKALGTVVVSVFLNKVVASNQIQQCSDAFIDFSMFDATQAKHRAANVINAIFDMIYGYPFVGIDFDDVKSVIMGSGQAYTETVTEEYDKTIPILTEKIPQIENLRNAFGAFYGHPQTTTFDQVADVCAALETILPESAVFIWAVFFRDDVPEHKIRAVIFAGGEK